MSQSYLGIDLHKRRSYVVLMDEGGDVLDERALPNGDMAEYLAERVPRATTDVMEATFNWPFMYDLVSEHVERVLLAHPQKVKLIAEATVKTDKVDAHTLTHLARTGYLPESYAAPKWLRELRRLMRHRQNLIADHTRHKNRIHSVLHSYNLSSPLSDLFGSKGRAFLAELLCDPAGPLTPSACQVIEDSMARHRPLQRTHPGARSGLQCLCPHRSGYRSLAQFTGCGFDLRHHHTSRIGRGGALQEWASGCPLGWPDPEGAHQ